MHKKRACLRTRPHRARASSVGATWAYTCLLSRARACHQGRRRWGNAGGRRNVGALDRPDCARSGELHNRPRRVSSPLPLGAPRANSQDNTTGLDSSGLAVRPLGDVILVQQTSSEQVSTVAPTPTRPIPQPPLGPMP